MNCHPHRLSCVASILLAAACAAAEPPGEAGEVERIATGYRFTEGPVAGPDGLIYFSDIPNNTIATYDPATGKAGVFTDQSGHANGLMFDAQGRLLACRHGGRDLVGFNIATGRATSLVDRYDGRRLNSPNDLTIDSAGGVYFTDPRYGRRDDLEMRIEGVYYHSADGKLTRLIDDLKKPNGIALSPDGKTLYVADWGAPAIVAYRVIEPGELGPGKTLIGSLRLGMGGPDGMGVDRTGRLYVALPMGVGVYEANGERVEVIRVPEKPTNCTLVGDGLYITAGQSLYRVKVVVGDWNPGEHRVAPGRVGD